MNKPPPVPLNCSMPSQLNIMKPLSMASAIVSYVCEDERGVILTSLWMRHSLTSEKLRCGHFQKSRVQKE